MAARTATAAAVAPREPEDFGLDVVDPNDGARRSRICLWAPPGFGKSAAAATAPGPIVAVTSDRPGSWNFARAQQPGKTITEVRFRGITTLGNVYRYLRANPQVETIVLDPFQQIYDQIVKEMPRRGDGDTDWNAINDKVLGFLYSLRDCDVHVVICAHEKLSDGKKGDGKMYPSLGGPSLINKVMAEMDVVASLQPVWDEETGEVSHVVGSLHSTGSLVNKEGTGAKLPARMEVDLTAWFDMIAVALKPDESDIPFSEDFEGSQGDGGDDPGAEDEASVGAEQQMDLDDARAKAA